MSLPTLWARAEHELVRGTSLEAALRAKLPALEREFALLQEATAPIGWCQSLWWDPDTRLLMFQEWMQADALYRSRALDLPGSGHVMVPCIDMANHAAGESTVALYDTDSDGNAVLSLSPGKSCLEGQEITITYGDEKGACEMLFSYGFIDDAQTSAREMYLDLEIPDDDPLRLAKKAVAESPPGFRLFVEDDRVRWEGPYVWLLCVNEEDGLRFRLLQTNDGAQELQVFWNEAAIDHIAEVESILKADPLWDVFSLRAITVLHARVEAQFQLLQDSRSVTGTQGAGSDHLTHAEQRINSDATRLGTLETALLRRASECLAEEVRCTRHDEHDEAACC